MATSPTKAVTNQHVSPVNESPRFGPELLSVLKAELLAPNSAPSCLTGLFDLVALNLYLQIFEGTCLDNGLPHDTDNKPYVSNRYPSEISSDYLSDLIGNLVLLLSDLQVH